MKLTDLPGVGEATEKKFNKVDIHTAEELINYSPEDVADITGLSSMSVKSIYKKIFSKMREEKLIPERFRSGTEVDQDRKELEYIKVGVEAFDILFENGVETRATTEIYGEFGSGKTQFCHTLAVRAQFSKEDGGLDTKVLWIDSENTFRPERIKTIAVKLGIDPDTALDKIIHAKAFNSTDQQIILEECEKLIVEEKIQLIIIDSSTGLFRSDYPGRGNLSNRQGALSRFVTRASRISETYNCAVVLTNQVYSSPGMAFGDPTRPVGGNIVAHSSTYRIYFKKSGKNRIAKMIDSPGHAENEVMFALSDGGVVDIATRDADIKEAKKLSKDNPVIVNRTKKDDSDEE